MKSVTRREQPDAAAFFASLDPVEREAIARAEAMLDGAEKGDAESTFVKGDAVKLARDSVRKGKFTEWCRLRWKRHRSYAYDHLRVAENLEAFRTRIIRARIRPSAVLKLATQPDRAEEVIQVFEAGERLSVSQVKRILGDPGDEAASGLAAEAGGLRGLKRLYALKRRKLRDLVDRLETIVAAVETSLAPTAEGGRVVKGALAEAIVLPARHARVELLNLCAFLEPAPHDPTVLRPGGFADGSQWGHLSDLLYEIGGAETWPPATRLEAWLREKVLPLLKWAARGDAAGLGKRPSGAGLAGGSEHGDADGGPPPPSAGLLHESSDHGPDITAPGVPEESIRQAAKFLSFLRRKARRDRAPGEKIEPVCRRTASVMADFIVCGRSVEETPGPAAAERRRVAELLYHESLAGRGESPRV